MARLHYPLLLLAFIASKDEKPGAGGVGGMGTGCEDALSSLIGALTLLFRSNSSLRW